MISRTGQMTNYIPFPTTSTPEDTQEGSLHKMSLISTRPTALDVCYFVYGENATSENGIERFYEANASHYENPLLTASSRSVINDIHRITRQFSIVDFPRPLAVLCTLFRVSPSSDTGIFGQNSDDRLFRALRVWTEVGDICENESFDGHKIAIVEHTLNVLLLPGIHCNGPTNPRFSDSSDSLFNTTSSPCSSHFHHNIYHSTSIPVPYTAFSFPSPLHFKLAITTRLSFNEQGRVTHHRDMWDVKDVMGLVPGVSLAQWIGSRIAAVGLSYIAKLLPSSKGRDFMKHSTTHAPLTSKTEDLENGYISSQDFPPPKKFLGMEEQCPES